MPLTLVTGPAGSGKTGEILERFSAWLEREPVLVTPTLSDVERFEGELLARRPVALGGRIVTFERLFELAAASAGIAGAGPLGSIARQALVASVVAETPLQAMAAPARRSGFAGALDSFISEVKAARVSPAGFAARLRGMAEGRRGEARYLSELAALVAGYEKRLEGLGLADSHSLAAMTLDSLRADPGRWGDRPVLLYGFDDLTREQLELVGTLSAATDVVVSLVHEPLRACLVARERLLGQLESLGGEVRERLAPVPGSSVLSHLERGFLVDEAPRRAPDESLVLLDSAGRLSEVEHVGARIASLLRGGVPAAGIAVIARVPEEHADLIERVFDGYGIPVAVDAARPLGRTPLGAALIALVRAALTSRSAADLVSYLRFPGRGAPARVDRLERAIRRDRMEEADEVARSFEADGGRRLWELDRLRGAYEEGPETLLGVVADIARDLFEYPRKRTAPQLDAAARGEALAGEQAARALEQLAGHPSLAPAPEGLVDLLETLPLRTRGGSSAGKVEVMSPYRARARQYDHVFVLSLQEGDFPRRGRDDPFLTEEECVAAGLPERADQGDEERYLFYSALSRATRRLYLSYRSADDDGRESSRSFFVEDVLELLTEGAEDGIVTRRDLAATVFEPTLAPSERELARALAVRRETAPAPQLGAAKELAGRLRPRLERARRRADFLPGSFSVPAVRRHFAAREYFGASSLESYGECPFRYFVQHELRPRGLEPDADALARGSAIHAVLERLYAERGLPSPDSLEDAQERARELLAEQVRATALEPSTPAARTVYRRMESDVLRFLAYDARHPARLELVAVEAGFGEDPENHDRPPLDLGGVKLHGKIDRIDRAPEGTGLVRDYKSGRAVTPGADLLDELKLQLPLYMLALRELWGIEPAGALYHPLGSQEPQVPRGLLRGPRGEAPFDGPELKKTDFTSSEEAFEGLLEEARRKAIELAGAIRDGRLARDPVGGSCPAYCNFHPICRRERGEKNPELPQRPAPDA